ncbi:Solute carrier organic anion transporter family member 3A1 [Sarcoptes scabiei]|nr:Solute carrier organic anion transporter family member 3A1 [Sarcoptes scabiei]
MRSLVRRPSTINNFVNKIFQINNSQSNLQLEIHCYNDQICRFMSIVVLFSTIMITYLTYIIYSTSMPMEFVVIFAITLSSHTSLLIVLIYSSSKISTMNKHFAQWSQKIPTILSNRFSQRSLRFFTKNELKLSTVSYVMLKRPIGFSLSNDYLITSMTYFQIFYNISSFFFLIFGGTFSFT